MVGWDFEVHSEQLLKREASVFEFCSRFIHFSAQISDNFIVTWEFISRKKGKK